MRRADGRGGFTVLELTVALAVAGTVILAAWSMVDQVARTSADVVAFARESDREANAERLLRSMLSGIETRVDSLNTFAGSDHSVRFVTRCDRPGGWQEPCAAALAIMRIEGQAVLHAVFSDRIVVLRSTHGGASFRYLDSAADGGHWLPSWSSTLSMPLAVGVVSEQDTLILRIGERG